MFALFSIPEVIFIYFISQLKRELESFGPDFFEEIEDLKYNYKQTMKRCRLLEDKLRQLAQQFGVSIGIPGFD